MFTFVWFLVFCEKMKRRIEKRQARKVGSCSDHHPRRCVKTSCSCSRYITIVLDVTKNAVLYNTVVLDDQKLPIDRRSRRSYAFHVAIFHRVGVAPRNTDGQNRAYVEISQRIARIARFEKRGLFLPSRIIKPRGTVWYIQHAPSRRVSRCETQIGQDRA